ncbi:MAG: hypothetical protein M3552_17635 [Planctomycetota bacterium]|nr:hypothetical protein [Planctomycetaceae bacterium]MDQ3332442.1 hypothetical protein [Planctomycetota bacterium]
MSRSNRQLTWPKAIGAICALLAAISVRALADSGVDFPANPFTPGNCYDGSGTTTPPATYGTGSLKYKCNADQSNDERCLDDAGKPVVRKKCVVSCDDHCKSCFSHGTDGKFVKWSTGPLCVGNCVVDNAGGTCSGCDTGQLICAVGSLYTDAACTTPTSPAMKVWDMFGGQKPCSP